MQTYSCQAVKSFFELCVLVRVGMCGQVLCRVDMPSRLLCRVSDKWRGGLRHDGLRRRATWLMIVTLYSINVRRKSNHTRQPDRRKEGEGGMDGGMDGMSSSGELLDDAAEQKSARFL